MLRSVRCAIRMGVVAVPLLLAAGSLAPGVASASPPDDRAYELVSPASAKNGGDVLVDSTRVRAAQHGNAAGFSSLAAFGDAVGTGVATDYMSVRSRDPNPGTNGWTTHAITPVQAEPLSVQGLVTAGEPLYLGDFSADLSRAVFRAWAPIGNAPYVRDLVNLYAREDVQTPGAGTYSLVTVCSLCATSGTALLAPALSGVPLPVYGGASGDFTHVAMEVRESYTPDAPAEPAGCTSRTATFSCQPRAYEWSDGQLHLVGLIPTGSDISCGAPGENPCVAASQSALGAGLGGAFNRPVHVISADGSRVFFTDPTTGMLYVRTDNAVTDQIDASERTDCAGDPACGGDARPDPMPDAFAPARYWGASADGSRVFFTTTEALTDDAPVNGDRKLYVYDTQKLASDPHNLTLVNVGGATGDPSNDVGAVLGVSDSGRYVYFLNTGQLVAGRPLLNGSRGIFVWHDGEIQYIGQMAFDETQEAQQTGTALNLLQTQTRMTPDGRDLLLSAHDASGFSTGYDNGVDLSHCGITNAGCRQLYLYSTVTQSITCVSCAPDGQPPVVDASTTSRTATGGSSSTWHMNRAITDDGSRVFFTTANALLPEDVNGKNDVYEYDVTSGALHLISTGTSPYDSYFMDASPDGRDVFFVTRERLVKWDTDSSGDLYDARVGGGFPDPPTPPVQCSGSACQGASDASPPAPDMASSTLRGAGNLTATLRKHARRGCRRGYVKRRIHGRTKCVRHAARHKPHAAKLRPAGQRRGK